MEEWARGMRGAVRPCSTEPVDPKATRGLSVAVPRHHSILLSAIPALVWSSASHVAPSHWYPYQSLLAAFSHEPHLRATGTATPAPPTDDVPLSIP